jgi:hypothetical protein
MKLAPSWKGFFPRPGAPSYRRVFCDVRVGFDNIPTLNFAKNAKFRMGHPATYLWDSTLA